MKVKRFADDLEEYLFGVVPLTRTSTYSDVLDKALRFEAWTGERQVEQEPRKKVKTRGQVVGQFEAIGSGIAAGTNILARGQRNEDGSVT